MRLFQVSSALVFGMVVGCAVDSPAPESTERTSLDLVGGQVVDPSQLSSTIYVETICTAAKVGPRHILLAAHCVHNAAHNDVNSRYAPGQQIRISASKTIAWDDPSYRTFEIERTFIPPWWTSGCKRPCVNNMLGAAHPEDVAVIVVKSEIVGIPTASVDLRPIELGDPVLITGVGCEAGLRGPSDPHTMRQKVQRTSTIDWSHLGEYGRPKPTPQELDVLAAKYFLTPGQSLDPKEASLCPGDSGGPVYREDTAGPVIVGVNSFYSFPPEASDPNGISNTNWHARVDNGSEDKVGAWLADLGVSTVTTSPPSKPRDAFGVIRARTFDAQAGTTAEPCKDDGGGEDVGAIANGDSLVFRNVVFGEEGPGELALRIASGAAAGVTGNIELPIDGVTGPKVADVAVGNTGGWQSWTTLTAPVSGLTGTHDVHVVFTSASPSDFVSLNWFSFALKAKTKNPYDKIDGVAFDAETDVRVEPCAGECAGPNVGHIADSGFAVFRNVDFGATPPRQLVVRATGGAKTRGHIEFRVGNASGPRIADVAISNGHRGPRWQAPAASVGRVTGVVDLYVVYRGAKPSDFANVDWFSFQRAGGCNDEEHRQHR
jgi:hypothetical protein